MTRISLDQAQTIVSGTLAEARALKLKPISVAVLDAGGHLIAFAREDGSSNLRPQIATAKASGCSRAIPDFRTRSSWTCG